MCFRDEPRCIHHGEQGLIGGGEVTFKKRAISDDAVDGTRDSGITEQCFGAPHSAFRGRARALDGLERLLFSHALKVGKLFLRLLVLAAGLKKSNFGGIQVFPGNGSLLEQFLAALIDFLLRFEIRLRGDGVELCLLNLLRKASINGGHVVGVRLLEIALGGFRGGGQILVFQLCKQLSFFNSRASLHVEFLDGRTDLRRDCGLLQRIDYGFRRNHL